MHRLQSVLPPPLADAHISQLVEGVDEIRQIVDGLADEGEAEGQLITRLVAHPFFRRRFDDKRTRHGKVLAHYRGVAGRGGFEDVGIDALLFQDAVGTIFRFQGADDLLEGVAEAAA